MSFYRARFVAVDVTNRTRDLVTYLDQDGVRREMAAALFDAMYVPVTSTSATIGGALS